MAEAVPERISEWTLELEACARRYLAGETDFQHVYGMALDLMPEFRDGDPGGPLSGAIALIEVDEPKAGPPSELRAFRRAGVEEALTELETAKGASMTIEARPIETRLEEADGERKVFLVGEWPERADWDGGLLRGFMQEPSPNVVIGDDFVVVRLENGSARYRLGRYDWAMDRYESTLLSSEQRAEV